jgi:hypothetical protein
MASDLRSSPDYTAGGSRFEIGQSAAHDNSSHYSNHHGVGAGHQRALVSDGEAGMIGPLFVGHDFRLWEKSLDSCDLIGRSSLLQSNRSITRLAEPA